MIVKRAKDDITKIVNTKATEEVMCAMNVKFSLEIPEISVHLTSRRLARPVDTHKTGVT